MICQPGIASSAPLLACPGCGARLVTLSNEQPPRLICVRCGRLMPIKPGLPAYQRFMRDLRRLSLLIVLLILPLVVLVLSPWIEQGDRVQDRSRLGRLTTGRRFQRTPTHRPRTDHSTDHSTGRRP